MAAVWAASLTGSTSTAALVPAALYVPSLVAPPVGLLWPTGCPAGPCSSPWTSPALSAFGGPGAGDVWLLVVVVLGHGGVLVLVDAAEPALIAGLVPQEAGR